MRTHGSPEQLERQRRKAVALVQEGLGRSEVARRLGVNPSAITRWCQAFETYGEAGLTAKKHYGPKSKLNAQKRQWLVKRLLKGAKANGYPTDVWTCPRIADLIQRRYAVSYHVDHIPRLMACLGWSCQKPESRAVERDEQAIKQWVCQDWPRIKKSRNT
jgi:transposase